MKKFVFPLQDVMKYREFLQSRAEIELGKALAVEHGIQLKLEQIAAQHMAVKKQTDGSTDFNTINTAHNFMQLLEQQKELLLEQLAEAKLVSEQKRNILKEAVQKTEALHKLRERQLTDYHEAENKEEEDMTDDTTSSRFRKN